MIWFEEQDEAFEFMHDLIIDMIKRVKASKKKIKSLEDDKELLSQVVTTEKWNNKELSLKLDEHKKVVNVVDADFSGNIEL